MVNTNNRPTSRSLIQTHHLLRTLSFATIFVFASVQHWHKNTSALVWGLIILQFLVYPHLMCWRAMRAQDPFQAEMNNLLVDSFLLGLWVASLQFSLWISFTLFICSTLNNTLNQGSRGLRWAIVSFFSGLLLPVYLLGFHPDLVVDWTTTIVFLIGLTCYVLIVGQIAYKNHQKIRGKNHQIRLAEQALSDANKALQQQLADNQALQAPLSMQALCDPLTGLFNRRYLDTTLTKELARCKREHQPLSLVMIDLDHFKQINDTYGHQGGDLVLKNLADLLSQQRRAADVVSRYGGEEFLLLLPHITNTEAILKAEEWRIAFSQTPVPYEGKQIVATMSIGIASFPEHGDSPHALIRCADRALYRAKAEGRNRIKLFEAANGSAS